MRAPVFPTVAPGAGHYESFFVKGHHPTAPCAFWLRHTIHQRPGEPQTASLWLTLFDATRAERPVVAGKQTVLGASVPAGGYVAIAGAELSPGGARGRLASPTLDAAWDLTFATRESEQRHLPHDWMYGAPLPRTKSGTPHPGVTFGGEIAGIDVDGWRGLVSHNWGSQHAERWIWLHAALDDGWIELVLGRIRVGRLTTPWLAGGALQLGGARWRLGGVERTRATTVDEHPTGARLVVTGERGVRVELALRAPAEHLVCWRYADPDGGEHQTAHTSIADLRGQVSRPGRLPVVLDAGMTASYELGMREAGHGLPVQPYADGRL